MRKILLLTALIITVFGINVYSQEKIADFEKVSVPVLNDELGRILRDLASNESTATANATSIAAINSVPQGAIIMWSGTIANIPSGYELCDGSCTITCPDLRGKMIVAADSGDDPGTKTGDATKVAAHTHTQDSHNHNLATNIVTSGRIYLETVSDSGANGTTHIGAATATNQSAGSESFYALAYIIKN